MAVVEGAAVLDGWTSVGVDTRVGEGWVVVMAGAAVDEIERLVWGGGVGLTCVVRVGDGLGLEVAGAADEQALRANTEKVNEAARVNTPFCLISMFELLISFGTCFSTETVEGRIQSARSRKTSSLRYYSGSAGSSMM
jgi:hypothetical protein